MGGYFSHPPGLWWPIHPSKKNWIGKKGIPKGVIGVVGIVGVIGVTLLPLQLLIEFEIIMFEIWVYVIIYVYIFPNSWPSLVASLGF